MIIWGDLATSSEPFDSQYEALGIDMQSVVAWSIEHVTIRGREHEDLRLLRVFVPGAKLTRTVFVEVAEMFQDAWREVHMGSAEPDCSAGGEE